MEIYQSEKEFEKSFAEQVKWRKGWEYIKIPDVIPQKTKSGQYYIPSAHKRPFDGILATPYGNWAVELKYGKGQLKPHQEEILQQIGYLNGMAIVIWYKPGEGYRLKRWLKSEKESDKRWSEDWFPEMDILLDALDILLK